MTDRPRRRRPPTAGTVASGAAPRAAVTPTPASLPDRPQRSGAAAGGPGDNPGAGRRGAPAVTGAAGNVIADACRVLLPARGRRGINPDATGSAAIKGPPRSVRRFMPARCRAPRRAVPLARTDAGGALGREALDAATVASGAGIKPGDRSRGPRRAVPLRQDRCRWRDRPRAPSMPPAASGAGIKPGEALHREARAARCRRRAAPLDVPCRCARTVAGGALGLDALDCRHGGERPPGSSPAIDHRTRGPWCCRHGGERRQDQAGRARRGAPREPLDAGDVPLDMPGRRFGNVGSIPGFDNRYKGRRNHVTPPRPSPSPLPATPRCRHGGTSAA